jgi:hypothetical protein
MIYQDTRPQVSVIRFGEAPISDMAGRRYAMVVFNLQICLGGPATVVPNGSLLWLRLHHGCASP